MKAKKNKFGVFSFFSGAGFLDLGFEKAGFTSLMANEIDASFCSTFRFSREQMDVNLPKYGLVEKNICLFMSDPSLREELRSKMQVSKSECDLVGFIGGPPCPDFSVAGKNKGVLGSNGKLSQIYTDLIIEFKPDFFVFENVKGLWRTAKHRDFFDNMLIQFKKSGYVTTCKLINALEYGVPQDRERIILIGVNSRCCAVDHDKENNILEYNWDKHVQFKLDTIGSTEWPDRDKFVEDGIFLQPPNIIPELTVEYWFKKNSVLSHYNSEDFFKPRAGLKKMKVYDEGDTTKKCYKRLHRWRYSPTAAYGNNEVHLHPYKARRLSVAEALAIQSLPPSFCLPKTISLTSMFKTIGNGVPYKAAYGIARTLREFLLEVSHEQRI